MRDAMRATLLVSVVVLSIGVTAYAVLVYALLPLGAYLHPEIRAAFEQYAGVVYVHVFGSAVALGLGPLQFWSRLRARRPRFHRWCGRLYLGAGVLVGGLAGLYIALHAFGGLPARLGFAALAAAWLFTGMRAFLAIRVRDIEAHRRWMVRNFALTLAAVTLRLWVPAAVASGIAFEVAYPAIAWLCWVPNLLLAEVLLRREAGPASEVV
jgi:uncharacterized membrane protein